MSETHERLTDASLNALNNDKKVPVWLGDGDYLMLNPPDHSSGEKSPN